MSTPDIQRGLGQAEGRIAGLERNISEIKDSIETQGERLGRIESTLSEAKGSWRTLLAIAGLAGTIGAVLAKVIPFIPWGR